MISQMPGILTSKWKPSHSRILDCQGSSGEMPETNRTCLTWWVTQTGQRLLLSLLCRALVRRKHCEVGYKGRSLLSPLSQGKANWGRELGKVAHLLFQSRNCEKLKANTSFLEPWLLENLGESSGRSYLGLGCCISILSKGISSRQCGWDGQSEGSDCRCKGKSSETGTTGRLVHQQTPFHSSFCFSWSPPCLCSLWATTLPCSTLCNCPWDGNAVSHSPIWVSPYMGSSCLNRFRILNAHFMPDSSEGFNKSLLKEGALGNNSWQSCGLGTCFSNWDFQSPWLQRGVLGPPWECGEGCSQLCLLL